MDMLTNWMAANGMHLGGVAAVVCGVALLYLVMARTQKRREQPENPQV